MQHNRRALAGQVPRDILAVPTAVLHNTVHPYGQAVQHLTDATDQAVSHKELWELFRTSYITP
ncbi:hypothetical protein AB4Z54_53190 [Streptomyces sp. MCAF7]